MVRNIVIADASTLEKHLANFKEGYEEVIKQAVTAIATSKEEGKDKDKDANIFGLREQITANVEILLPMMLSVQLGACATISDIHVITVGEAPNIKVYVLRGPATGCKKFLESEAAPTPAAALNNMLILTQKLLQEYDAYIGTFSVNNSNIKGPIVAGAWGSKIPNIPRFNSNLITRANPQYIPPIEMEASMFRAGLSDRFDKGVEKDYNY